jgi:hypothetical protein
MPSLRTAIIDHLLLAPARAVSTIHVPVTNTDSFAEKTEGLYPLTRADTRLSHAPQSAPETTQKNFRTQRFEKAFGLLSNQIDQFQLKGHSPPIRSTAWLHLFDLATYPQQLEHVSSTFSQFVENSRPFRDGHVNAFVRTCFERKQAQNRSIIKFRSDLLATGRCVELNCPELALNVFSNRPAYRMDLTLAAARHLLYALHEKRQLSNIVILATLFPHYDLPALSSDPISCALLVSACLREANSSGSEPAWTVGETFLSPLKQLLSQTSPMPVPVEANRFLESRWMKDAILSILDSLAVRSHETSWVRAWCYQSGYNLSGNIN